LRNGSPRAVISATRFSIRPAARSRRLEFDDAVEFHVLLVQQAFKRLGLRDRAGNRRG